MPTATPSLILPVESQSRELDPKLRLSNLTDWLPIERAENLATLVDGLRRAGLPE